MGYSLKIFVSLFIAYAFFTNFYLTTNDNPRFSLTAAIAEEHRFMIDSFYNRSFGQLSWDPNDLTLHRTWWNNVDYTVFNGHVYSDKAPMGSFLAVPFYFVARLLTSDPGVLEFICSLFVSGLLTALTGVFIYRIGGYLTDDEGLRVIVALSYGLGSMAFSYATVFFPHNISAFFVFGCFFVLFLVKRKRLSDNYIFLAGFLAASAALSDYYMLLVGFCLLVYCFSFARGSVAKFMIPFVLTLLLLPLYHYALFGNPLVFPLNYHATFNQEHSQGFYGVLEPNLDVAVRLLFSPYKSVFFFNPLLILSVILFPRFYRAHRLEALVVASVSILLFVFNDMYYAWDGGSCVGPRHLCALIPFMLLPLFSLRRKGFEQNLLIFFFILGLAINFIYVNSRMHVLPLDLGPFVVDVPIIPMASNALNQAFLHYGVALSFTTGIVIAFFLYVLWSKELAGFFKRFPFMPKRD